MYNQCYSVWHFSLQEIQTLQGQLDQQKEQLATGETTKMEIEAVRDYRQLRQQQQHLEAQVEQLTQQLAQVGQVLGCRLRLRWWQQKDAARIAGPLQTVGFRTQSLVEASGGQLVYRGLQSS